jgi:sulfur-carrier protein adenylyltransferase/sulfurtransferase
MLTAVSAKELWRMGSEMKLDERGLPAGYGFREGVEVTPREVKRMLDAKEDFVLIDCRLPQEAAVTKIEGSTLIPLQQIQSHADELMKLQDKKIVVYCKVGGRSLQFVQMLRNSGFKNATSMAGGILLWNSDVNPDGPLY